MNLSTFGRVADWLSYARNRARVYTTGKAALTLLAADGVISGPTETKIIATAAWLIACPALHLASKNTPKP